MACKVEIHSDDGVKSTMINADRFVIGRSTKADIIIDEDGISRNHLIVTIKNNTIYLLDEGSSNGTFVEKNRLHAKQEITYNSNNKIRLGPSKKYIKLSIVNSADKEAAATTPSNKTSNNAAIDKVKKEAQDEITRMRFNVEDELAQKRVMAQEKLEVELKQLRDHALADINAMKLAAEGEIKAKNELIIKITNELADGRSKLNDNTLALEAIIVQKNKNQKELDENQKNVLEMRNEMATNKKKIIELQAELDKLGKEKKIAIEARESELKIAKMNLEVELQELQSKKVISEREFKLKEIDKKNIEDIILQQEDIKQKLQLSVAELKDTLEQKRAEAQKEISSLELSKKDLRDELELIRKEMGSCKVESVALEEKKISMECEITGLLDRKKQAEDEMVDKNIQLNREKEQIEGEIAKAKSELQATLAELKLQKVTLKVESEKALSSKKILEKEIEDLKTAKANLLNK
ncbi:MAG: hypothetical protein A2504_14155 [Bdellovibrionales bacterium RIFOXYD12_FULL_39_22]|nr:MAG: hypothetical protein A2385_04590 [Bdellovibrionales bacterium RIFOXYB1_FULL_39_21]OFZ43426.1 MAG: hypothetical protein A2485_13105 [Bdellovibrionales bacterium RIFOXYC12_FULL_39_17]OFZ46969.1 MAG: hypothetical protein A2404_00165 [Bdellovibrionales bacterium RIFOXYC1_FULL_39_130]OFZ76166.1 MAG: hypothetical protein A2560_07415 [Bdellovibrionales bacterium RIFOXYD1_FULL_39_84]OFZ94401.1 MAG: hypothetical protein A2504_14155 [Bdellovibrionales bacterium RIFOXYD12_FULL_39_22]HLE10559.1 FH